MDNATRQKIMLLHPDLRDEISALIEKANARLTTHSQVRITDGFRSFEEQHKLFLQRPKVTQADSGQSFHNYGVAFDFALLIDNKEIKWDIKHDWDGDKVADWMEVVSVFREAGWEWGGSWKFTDNPHLQKTGGQTWQQLLAKYRAGQFIPGTKYIRLK